MEYLICDVMNSFKVTILGWTFQNCGELVADKPTIILNL